jgi:hypothetical protein
MKIDTMAGFDKDMLLEMAKAWETEYYEKHKTDNWKGYVQIMCYLNKRDDIPKKDGLKAHLNVLAMMETA